jgi:hypothetical protein
MARQEPRFGNEQHRRRTRHPDPLALPSGVQLTTTLVLAVEGVEGCRRRMGRELEGHVKEIGDQRERVNRVSRRDTTTYGQFLRGLGMSVGGLLLED